MGEFSQLIKTNLYGDVLRCVFRLTSQSWCWSCATLVPHRMSQKWI